MGRGGGEGWMAILCQADPMAPHVKAILVVPRASPNLNFSICRPVLSIYPISDTDKNKSQVMRFGQNQK